MQENEFLSNRFKDFDPKPTYEDPSRSPFMVGRQTLRTLELWHHNLIVDPTYERDYLQHYTQAYLQQAAEGCIATFSPKGAAEISQSSREAFDHSLVIIAHLPTLTFPGILPDGFSTQGMMRPPQTPREFLARLREMQTEIAFIANGFVKPEQVLIRPQLIRTEGFFAMAGTLPIQQTSAEIQERNEYLGRLLEGVNLDLKDL